MEGGTRHQRANLLHAGRAGAARGAGAVWARSEGSAPCKPDTASYMDSTHTPVAHLSNADCVASEHAGRRNAHAPITVVALHRLLKARQLTCARLGHRSLQAIGSEQRQCIRQPAVGAKGAPLFERAGPRVTGCGAPQGSSWSSASVSSGRLPSGRSSASELLMLVGRRGRGLRRGCLLRACRAHGSRLDCQSLQKVRRTRGSSRVLRR